MKAKINEQTRVINWLMGMRSDGGPISDGGRGPVIPSGGGSQIIPMPWATDPNGNSAGWISVITLDSNSLYVDQQYVWGGPLIHQMIPPWTMDPDGNPAQWVQHAVCEGGEVVTKWFWGTP